jgi:ABC-type amino acid transport substrate-binding protein
MRHRTAAILVLAALAALAVSPARAQQLVRLGAYQFPPYAVDTADGMGGMVEDLAAAMNEAQGDYVFKVVPTTATQRYADLQAGRYDAIAFEDLAWGWKDEPVQASDVFMEGREVYVALKAPGRDQSFFDDLASKTIAVVYGYHYGFAGFNADPGWLARHFRVEESLMPSTSLVHLLQHQADVAVVPDLLLGEFVKRYPQYKDAFLVGDKPDQVYHHTILVRRDGPLPVATVDAILAGLKQSGAIDRLVAPYRAQD